jgi:hypothetical protein
MLELALDHELHGPRERAHFVFVNREVLRAYVFTHLLRFIFSKFYCLQCTCLFKHFYDTRNTFEEQMKKPLNPFFLI